MCLSIDFRLLNPSLVSVIGFYNLRCLFDDNALWIPMFTRINRQSVLFIYFSRLLWLLLLLLGCVSSVLLWSVCSFETRVGTWYGGRDSSYMLSDCLELQISFFIPPLYCPSHRGNRDDKTTELKRKHPEGFSWEIYSHYAKYTENPNSDR